MESCCDPVDTMIPSNSEHVSSPLTRPPIWNVHNRVSLASLLWKTALSVVLQLSSEHWSVRWKQLPCGHHACVQKTFIVYQRCCVVACLRFDQRISWVHSCAEVQSGRGWVTERKTLGYTVAVVTQYISTWIEWGRIL